MRKVSPGGGDLKLLPLATLLVLLPGAAPAQEPDPRGAQAAFERFRVARLRFVPTLAAIADPAVSSPADWPLDDPAPRATYAPAYARRFMILEPQIAAFRRGTGAVLVVGWSLPPDLVRGAGGLAAAVLASEGPTTASWRPGTRRG